LLSPFGCVRFAAQEAGYVEARALSTGAVEYEITEAGMAAIAEA